MLKKQISCIKPHLKIIGICYYAIVLKEENKTQMNHSHNFMKTHIVKQTKHELRHDISKHVNFRKTRNCSGPLH